MPHNYPQWRTLTPGKRAVICAFMAGCLFWMATDAVAQLETDAASPTTVAAYYGLSAALAAVAAYQALRWLLGRR